MTGFREKVFLPKLFQFEMALRNTALQSASRWMKQPVQYNMLNGMTSRSLHNNRSVQSKKKKKRNNTVMT